LQSFTATACHSYSIDHTLNPVRWWLKPQEEEEWRLLLKKQQHTNGSGGGGGGGALTLEEVAVCSGDVLMLEVATVTPAAATKTTTTTAAAATVEGGEDKEGEEKEKEGTTVVVWPKDTYHRYTQQFRQFHIDAKVDAMDRENKWYTGTIVHIDRHNADSTPTEVVVSRFVVLFFCFFALFIDLLTDNVQPLSR